MRVSQIIRTVGAQLREGCIPSPILDAELLVSHALHTERFRLHATDDRELTADEVRRINRLTQRRLRFEPIAYILGTKEFYSLDFTVNRHVLIPRPETELLVDLAVYHARWNAPVVDIGTGSGAIAVSVKHSRPDLEMHATDISSRSLTVARKNAARILGRNMIKFHQGNLFRPLSRMRFQVIVINPPYVNRMSAVQLQKDLSFEPEVALYSGRKGREIIERVIAGSGSHLTDDGVLIMEIGDNMKDFIKKAGKVKRFSVSILNDYSGLPRVAVMKR